jgi:hypothetical protein
MAAKITIWADVARTVSDDEIRRNGFEFEFVMFFRPTETLDPEGTPEHYGYEQGLAVANYFETHPNVTLVALIDANDRITILDPSTEPWTVVHTTFPS